MANEINGADVRLYVQDGTTPTQWNYLGGQRGLELGNTAAEIDVSSKDQAEEKTLPGRIRRELSLEALYGNSQAAAPDTAYVELKAAFDAQQKITVQIWERDPADQTLKAISEGAMSVLEMSESHPDQEGSTVAIRGKVDAWGAPTP